MNLFAYYIVYFLVFNQVMPSLTRSSHADISIQTTAASGVWVSADHRCIVWCKQLVLALNRALFDLIEPETKQIASDKNLRDKVFRYHLVQRTAGKRYKIDLHPESQVFDKEGEWTEITTKQHIFKSDAKLVKNTYLKMKTDQEDDSRNYLLTVDAVNMDLDNWIFACNPQSENICESGINLSNRSVIMPSNGKRKSVTLDLSVMKKDFSHVVIFIAKGMDHVRVSLDVYSAKDRTVEVKLPKWITFWYESRLVKLTLKNAMIYNLNITELDSPWQAYEISASIIQCYNNKKDNVSKHHYGLMKTSHSWALDQSYALLGANVSNTIVTKLLTPKTSLIKDPRSEVTLYLDQDCRYAISVRPDLSEMFAQIVRFYYPMVLPLSLSIILMIISNQLKILEHEGIMYPCHQILWSQVSPISSVMPARLLMTLLAYLSIPITTDIQLLAERGVDFGMLPIMMYFISICLVLVLTFAALTTVIIFGNTMQKFVTRFIQSRIPVPASGMVTEVVADSVLSGLTRFPIVLAGILILLGTSTCGTLALCLGTLFHFLKLFKMYKKYCEWLVKKSMGMLGDDQPKTFELDQLHFHLALGLLWTMTTVLNIPSLLAWSHDLSFAWPLAFDHSYLISVIYCANIPVLWSETYPNKFKTNYSRLSFGLQFCSILIVLLGLVSLYRLNYILCCAMMMLGAHQVTSAVDPSKTFLEDAIDTTNEEGQEKEKTD